MITNIWQAGQNTKTAPSVRKSARPSNNQSFTGGQLVQIEGQYRQDWFNIAPLATGTPASRWAIVSSDMSLAPTSYITHLEGFVAVPVVNGISMTSALLYDTVNKVFTTTANANTVDVSTRLRLEQVMGSLASVEFF